MKRLALAALTLVAVAAPAAPVGETAARTAARNFLSSDDVGARLLFGHTLDALERRGALWVARLKPAGYIVLSGDDAAEPVVAFSRTAYAEPPSDSPFAALLATADTNVLAAVAADAVRPLAGLRTPALAAVPAEGRRAAKWATLLGRTGAARARTARAWVDPSTLTVEVAPFLTTTWSQVQPYNDFVPINREASPDTSYRQRYPCGCVATAYAQMLAYWQWPARMDAAFTCDHDVYDTAGAARPFRIRFDAHAPFDWTQLRDAYAEGSPYLGWDLRGRVNESLRFTPARLVMLSAVLSKMFYAGGGSGANMQNTVNANPWYVQTNAVVRTALGDAAFFGLVRDDLRRGIPVGVTVPGHQVVAHGWAEGADATRYVYLNYGWGAYNDGYFNVSETDAETTAKGYIDSALLGHTPIRTAQLDALPAVCDGPVALAWHVPPRLADAFTGYDVLVRRRLDTPADAVEDFSSHATATDAPSGIFVAQTWCPGATAPFLRVKPLASGTFDLMEERTLTARSILSYRVRADRAHGLSVRVQARFDGGEWEDLDAPSIGDGFSDLGWTTRTAYLGDRGGRTVRLRLAVSNNGFYVPASDTKIGVQIDDVTLTDVLGFEETAVACGAEARSVTLDDLVPGAVYAFAVRPRGEGTSTSASVQTRLAGVGRDPAPGALAYEIVDRAFTAGDPDWQVATQPYNAGMTVGTTAVLGAFDGTLAYTPEFVPTAESRFTFGWTAKGAYSSASDVLAVIFTTAAGETDTLWAVTNRAEQATLQNVSIPLAAVAGTRGTLRLVFSHTGSSYAYAGYGATIRDAALTAISFPVLPESVAWTETAQTARPLPEIRAVTSLSETSPAVQEGFYRECARGDNVFFVTCSEDVTRLEARPSHLSLVPDEAVAVFALGGGRFAVTVDGGGIVDGDDRSRMILTLVASNGAGPAAYKDLSLRFAAETAPETYPAEKVTATPVPVPHRWLVAKGLVAEGASDADMDAAARADPDGDGQPTYAEYLCGTDPLDGNDFLKVFIHLEGEEPVISWSKTNALARYTVLGVTNLNERTWTETNAANRAGMRFFRVRATPRD